MMNKGLLVNKTLLIILSCVMLTACARTGISISFVPKCKDGLLHYTHSVKSKDIGKLITQDTGILTYADDTPVHCTDDDTH